MNPETVLAVCAVFAFVIMLLGVAWAVWLSR
jgi:hypothetical protein